MFSEKMRTCSKEEKKSVGEIRGVFKEIVCEWKTLLIALLKKHKNLKL